MLFIIPVPFVLVKNSPREPIRPRVGIVKSIHTFPLSVRISFIAPERFPIISITTPEYFSGTSTETSSMGSIFFPFTSFKITSGFETSSSNPSRRIFSTNIARCNSPRPATTERSADAVGTTESATSVSSSCSRRSLMFRDVVYSPSFPRNGEVFTPNVILIVGSSISIIGSATGFFTSAIVSPIEISGIPATATMSPAYASGTSTRAMPSKSITELNSARFASPARLMWQTAIPFLRMPE